MISVQYGTYTYPAICSPDFPNPALLFSPSHGKGRGSHAMSVVHCFLASYQASSQKEVCSTSHEATYDSTTPLESLSSKMLLVHLFICPRLLFLSDFRCFDSIDTMTSPLWPPGTTDTVP